MLDVLRLVEHVLGEEALVETCRSDRADMVEVSGVQRLSEFEGVAGAFDGRLVRLSAMLAGLLRARQITDLVRAELGIPREMFGHLTYPTHFDSTKAERALAGSGISVPPLPTYAQTLWEYWERTYSPDRRKDK
ncbi:MAG: hypothetical protein ACR2LX_11220, partial [Jatrophihabitans sp.]